MPALSGKPFSISEQELAQHLADLSVPTLLLSCVHITGDLSILDGPHQPHGLMANEEQGFMNPEEQSVARAFAPGLIKDYCDRGCPPLKPIPAEGLRRMMSWAACEPIDDTYLPMVLQEIGFDDASPLVRTAPSAEAAAARAALRNLRPRVVLYRSPRRNMGRSHLHLDGGSQLRQRRRAADRTSGDRRGRTTESAQGA